jgi:hypothetical protein
MRVTIRSDVFQPVQVVRDLSAMEHFRPMTANRYRSVLTSKSESKNDGQFTIDVSDRMRYWIDLSAVWLSVRKKSGIEMQPVRSALTMPSPERTGIRSPG